MIRAVVAVSLKFRGLVIGVAVAIIVLGSVVLRDAPVDMFPEFTPPYVEIQTESLGLSASEVEQFLTVPLEADLLNGVEGVEVIRSTSTPGLSSIVLVFQQGFDVYKGRQLVQERLTQLGGAAFPNVSKPPTMLPPLSSSSRVMMIGLSSQQLTPIQKSVIARWTVRPRIMGVPGVANVAVWGMRDQQIQVQVDPQKLRDKDVTLDQVIRTAGNAQIASPVSYLEASVPGTGGFIETPSQRLPIRNVFDNIASPQSLGRVPVEDTGGSLRLTDVATIVEDHQPLIGDAVVDDGEGLLLVVEKFPGADTREITEAVEAELDRLAPGLADLKSDTSVFRPAALIDQALGSIALSISIGVILLILTLGALLRGWRAPVVALLSLPVSLIAAGLVLAAFGATFNTISFAGLAVASVVVIDDAVVGAHHLALRMGRRGDRSAVETAAESTHTVTRPHVYATIITLLALVPLVVLEGRPGAFLEPIALAYTLAVLTSLVVSLSLAPAIASLLPGGAVMDRPRRLARWYAKALSPVTSSAGVVLVTTGVATVLVALTIPLLRTTVVPTLEDRNLLIRLESPAGTSNGRMTEIATELGKRIRGVDGVDNVGAAVGRAVTGDRIVDVNSGELVVKIGEDADYGPTVEAVRTAATQTDGADADVVTSSDQRLRDVGGITDGENPVRDASLHALTGVRRPITVRVFGQDPVTLETQAARVQKIIAQVRGAVDPRLESPEAQPTLEVEVDIEKAQKYGIKPGDVRRAEAIMLQGILVGSVFEDQKVFDVVVQGSPGLRESADTLRGLLIDTPEGGHVRLDDIAEIRSATAPTVIRRDSVSRRLDITVGVESRGVEAVADELEDRLQKVDMPLEYHAEVIDRTVDEEVNTGLAVVFLIAAAIAILLLLQALLLSWRLAAFALVGLPAGLIGGIVVVLLLGDGLTIGAASGLFALFALATRHTTTTLRHLQDLERASGQPLDQEMLRQGATERSVPVSIGLVAVAVVLLPFALLGSRPGLEVVHPMSLVVLGGLVSLAFYSLFVLPTVYLRARSGHDLEPDPDDDLGGPAQPSAGVTA